MATCPKTSSIEEHQASLVDQRAQAVAASPCLPASTGSLPALDPVNPNIDFDASATGEMGTESIIQTILFQTKLRPITS